MRTSEMKVTGSASKHSVKLNGPEPETLDEMASLCRDGEKGVLSLALQAWRVAVANPIRRVIDKAKEEGATDEQIQSLAQSALTDYRYGERVASAPKIKKAKVSGKISASILEQLAAQGIEIELED